MLQTALGLEAFAAFVTLFALDRFVKPSAQADSSADSSLLLVPFDDDFFDRVERMTGLDFEKDHLVKGGLCGEVWVQLSVSRGGEGKRI